jgi:DNA-binding response OmpR family regulator
LGGQRRFSLPMIEDDGIYYLADRQLEVDTQAQLVMHRDARLDISLRLFDVLTVLAMNPDTILPAETLATKAWGVIRDTTPENFCVAISELRNRFERIGLGDRESGPVQTRRMLGYVGVSVLNGEDYLWQPDHQEIIVPKIGGLALNTSSIALKVEGGLPKPLKPPLFRLLKYMIENEGIVVSEGQLLELLEDNQQAANQDNLRVNIGLTRKLMGPVLGNPRHGFIQTVRGVGYTVPTA